MIDLVQITDCHVFADHSKLGYNQVNPYLSLQRIIAQVEQLQPDVLVITGDISGDGSQQSYQLVAKLLKQVNLSTKIYLIPGNHDNLAYMQDSFPTQYLWLNQAHIDLGQSWHLHLLNTHHQATIGQVSQQSLQSLQQYLSTHAEQFHLLAAHHHPIESGGWMDQHEWTNRDQLTALVTQHQCVKGMIYGHIHQPQATQHKHCLYMACPATCWQFANQAQFALNDKPPGYRHLTLLENGGIQTSVIYLQGHT